MRGGGLYWEAHAKPTKKHRQKPAGGSLGLIYTKP
jgi:hypothetical protein